MTSHMLQTIRCSSVFRTVRRFCGVLPVWACLWLLVGCDGSEVARAPEAPAPGMPQQGARSFGAGLDPDVPFVALDRVLATPEPFLGRELRTSGVVRRVCQKAGCWLELGPDGAPETALRVPMAGHAFFIPRDAVDKHAEIQGTLAASPLPPSTRDHLAGEGARTLGPLSLDATAVRVAP